MNLEYHAFEIIRKTFVNYGSQNVTGVLNIDNEIDNYYDIDNFGLDRLSQNYINKKLMIRRIIHDEFIQYNWFDPSQVSGCYSCCPKLFRDYKKYHNYDNFLKKQKSKKIVNHVNKLSGFYTVLIALAAFIISLIALFKN